MERRCRFLDNMPAFNYNTGVGEWIKTDETRRRSDTRHLGSTLMKTMLREVADFCDSNIKESWTQKGHQQVACVGVFLTNVLSIALSMCVYGFCPHAGSSIFHV